MPVDYVQIAEDEGEDPIEIPTEDDGTILLSTVTGQFPGATGLRYKPENGSAYRGIKLSDGVLHPPLEGGWGQKVFLCVFPAENKRKNDDTVSRASKAKRLESKLSCTDLIVLGLPYKLTEEELREYFEKFGELLVSQVKRDPSGHSKGYGFIRFANYESQMRVLSQRHMIDKRWCDVKIPTSKEGSMPQLSGSIPQLSGRIFVGRITEDITANDLREHFSQYGEVIDVYMPKPFRAFSFVTFLNPEVAQTLYGESHIIKGVSVNISNAASKKDNNKRYQDRGRFNSSQDREGFNGYDQHNNGMNWGNNGGGMRNNLDLSNFASLANPALIAAALSQAGWVFRGNTGPGPNNANQDRDMLSNDFNSPNNRGGMRSGPNNNDQSSWERFRFQSQRYDKRYD